MVNQFKHVASSPRCQIRILLSTFTQDLAYMTHEEPIHEQLDLLPLHVVKPVPHLSRLSFDIVECIKHSTSRWCPQGEGGNWWTMSRCYSKTGV